MITSLIVEGKVYIRHGDGVEELYDLEVDPAEGHNLAGTEGARDVLARCRQVFDRLGSDTWTSTQAPSPPDHERDAPPRDRIDPVGGAAGH